MVCDSKTVMAKLTNIFLIVAAIFSALLIIEMITRFLRITPEVGFIEKGRFRLSSNPKIGYELVPNLNYQGEDLNFYDYRGTSNSLGFRDYEHSLNKQNGILRVAILGDSIATGWGVLDPEKILPKLLEKELNERGIKTEVMNFAVSGYNTQQEVEIFKDKGIIFRPDLVVLAYNLTDTQKVDGGILSTLQSQGMQSGNFLPSQNQLLEKSHLARLTKIIFFDKSKIREGDSTKNSVDNSFNELSVLSKQHNFQVLVIVVPRFDDLLNYPFQQEHVKIKNYAKDNGFYYLDLLLYFQECSKKEIVYIDIYHPSEYGHICAAKSTASYIINNELKNKSVQNR